MLTASLEADYPEPFYDDYFADLDARTGACGPLVWANGRINIDA